MTQVEKLKEVLDRLSARQEALVDSFNRTLKSPNLEKVNEHFAFLDSSKPDFDRDLAEVSAILKSL